MTEQTHIYWVPVQCPKHKSSQCLDSQNIKFESADVQNLNISEDKINEKICFIEAREIIYHGTKPVSVPIVTTSQMEDQSKTFDWFLWEWDTVYHHLYTPYFDLSQKYTSGTLQWNSTKDSETIILMTVHTWNCCGFVFFFLFFPMWFRKENISKTINILWHLITTGNELMLHFNCIPAYFYYHICIHLQESIMINKSAMNVKM